MKSIKTRIETERTRKHKNSPRILRKMRKEKYKKRCWNAMQLRRWYSAQELSRYCSLTSLEVGTFLGRVKRNFEGVMSKKSGYDKNRRSVFWRKNKDVNFEEIKTTFMGIMGKHTIVLD